MKEAAKGLFKNYQLLCAARCLGYKAVGLEGQLQRDYLKAPTDIKAEFCLEAAASLILNSNSQEGQLYFNQANKLINDLLVSDHADEHLSYLSKRLASLREFYIYGKIR